MLSGWTMDSCMDFLRPRRAENGVFAPFEYQPKLRSHVLIGIGPSNWGAI